MNKFIKYFYLITLIFMFLPAFDFYMGGRTYRVLFIPMLILWGIILVVRNKNIIKDLYQFYKYTPFKYLAYFIIYILISTFILILLGIYSPIRAIGYLSITFILYFLPCYFLSAYFVGKAISLNFFTKFIYLALFLIFTYGIFDFVGKVFHIPAIMSIHHFIVNERMFLDCEHDTYVRLESVFAEPGWLGQFVFVFFPLIYTACLSKYKLFENKYLNFAIKKSLIPLAWTNIILSFSPIWLIFCAIQALWIFRKHIAKKLFNIKFIITAFIFSIVSCLVISFMLSASGKNIEANQITRIIDTVTSFANYETFLIVEPSLGTRVVIDIHLLKLFAHNVLLGAGFGNSPVAILPIYQASTEPMTLEVISHLKRGLANGQTQSLVGVIFYTLLAEVGLIGTTLFYWFISKNSSFLKKMSDYLECGAIKTFTLGIRGCVIAFIFATFYNVFISNPIWWFLFGICAAICIYYYKLQTNMEENQSEIIEAKPDVDDIS